MPLIRGDRLANAPLVNLRPIPIRRRRPRSNDDALPPYGMTHDATSRLSFSARLEIKTRYARARSPETGEFGRANPNLLVRLEFLEAPQIQAAWKSHGLGVPS